MNQRILIQPRRCRRVPRQFSWVDHRLVQDGYFQGCSTPALALYLFLITVSDARGLSWYSDVRLCEQLGCARQQLQDARKELCRSGLVAYRGGLYQVLDLAPQTDERPVEKRRNEPVAIGDVLKSMIGGVQ